ncbi:hypothetical protein TNCV_52201 [Trichonephila clavipes]|nr:hypothetical protein TNCV_52201 [Trichonephila clavipes]
MCNNSPTNKAPISKKVPLRNFDTGSPTPVDMILLKVVRVFSLTSPTSLNRFPFRLLFNRGNKKTLMEPDWVSRLDEAKEQCCCLSKAVETSKPYGLDHCRELVPLHARVL